MEKSGLSSKVRKVQSTNFNYGEFYIIKSNASLNSYKISVKEWRERTNAKGYLRKQEDMVGII